MKEETNKFMVPGQDQAQGQSPPGITSKTLSGALGMDGITQTSSSNAPGVQEQGQVHDLGDSKAEEQVSLDSLRGQPKTWAVSSLSQWEHPGISQCQDIKEEITTSCLPGLIDSRLLYSTRRALREPREAERNEQRIVDVPGCEEGRDHLHPRVSSREQSPSWPSPSSFPEGRVHQWTLGRFVTQGNILCHPNSLIWFPQPSVRAGQDVSTRWGMKGEQPLGCWGMNSWT